MDDSLFLKSIRETLLASKVCNRAPVHSHGIKKYYKSAVLVPLIKISGVWQVIFTKRTQSVKTHKGQISFPGGKWDNTDKSLEETALREAFEETGILGKDVHILGKLSSVTTPSAFRIFPFVGKVEHFDENVSEDEVDRIIFIPLKHLSDYSNMEIKNTHMGMKLAIDLPFFYYKDHTVWGATGIILKEFLDKCKDVTLKI